MKNILITILFLMITSGLAFSLLPREIYFVSELHPLFNSAPFLNYVIYPILIIGVFFSIIVLCSFKENFHNPRKIGYKIIGLVFFLLFGLNIYSVLLYSNTFKENNTSLLLKPGKVNDLSSSIFFPGSYLKVWLPQPTIKSIKGKWAAEFIEYPILKYKNMEEYKIKIDSGEIIGDKWIQKFEDERKMIGKISINNDLDYDWSENKHWKSNYERGKIEFKGDVEPLQDIEPAFFLFKIPNIDTLFGKSLTVNGLVHMTFPMLDDNSYYFTKDTLISLEKTITTLNKNESLRILKIRNQLEYAIPIIFILCSIFLALFLRSTFFIG